MHDLGDQIAYLVLTEGTPVYGSDEAEIGTVAHVLGDEVGGIFDGLVIREGLMRHRYVDADHVEAIYEGGVVLTIDAAAAADLPEPGPETPVVDADALPGMREKLKRAWEAISGKS